MIAVASLTAVVFVLGLLGFGWWRGWSMMLTLALTLGGVYILGSATGISLGLTLAGSPLLEDLAWRPDYLALEAWAHWPTLLSTMFLHANAAHFLANLVVFVLMGLGFEDRVGRGRFLLVFVVSGVFGSLLHSLTTLGSGIPVVGASGAVFGVIGAYATLYPRDKVILFFFIIWPNAPVYIAAVLYTLLELFAITVGGGGNVAHYAHLGGLLVGVVLALAYLRRGTFEATGPRVPVLDLERVRPLVQSHEQHSLYRRLLENRDEPEVRGAWLERLARATPCPDCGEPLESAKGALRSACGYKLPLAADRRA